MTYQAPPGLSAGVEATKSGDRGTTPRYGTCNNFFQDTVATDSMHMIFYLSNQQSKEKGGQQQELPDKPTDFQVRVHVLEARKLVGSNPNPTVKVACGRHIQQTSTQKGTNSPVFDEVSIRSSIVQLELVLKVFHHRYTLIMIHYSYAYVRMNTFCHSYNLIPD